MRAPDRRDDILSMTLLALRYDIRRGRFGRVLSGDRSLRRDVSSAAPVDDMDLSRELRLQELRERVASGAYVVDAPAIAGAIVDRLLAGGRLDPAPAEEHPPRSQCS